jgi:hypothetical protein
LGLIRGITQEDKKVGTSVGVATFGTSCVQNAMKEGTYIA